MVPLDAADLFGPRDFLYYKLHFWSPHKTPIRIMLNFLYVQTYLVKVFLLWKFVFLQIFVEKQFSYHMLEGLSKHYSFLDYGTVP